MPSTDFYWIIWFEELGRPLHFLFFHYLLLLNHHLYPLHLINNPGAPGKMENFNQEEFSGKIEKEENRKRIGNFASAFVVCPTQGCASYFQLPQRPRTGQ